MQAWISSRLGQPAINLYDILFFGQSAACLVMVDCLVLTLMDRVVQ